MKIAKCLTAKHAKDAKREIAEYAEREGIRREKAQESQSDGIKDKVFIFVCVSASLRLKIERAFKKRRPNQTRELRVSVPLRFSV